MSDTRNDATSTVLILGASTRAAAMSALRAGWTPWCADLFADADLQRVATVRKVPGDRYPDGLIAALAAAPPGPVIYTGALENRPDLIARIDRPLWGNPPDVLRAIRDPVRWTAAMREAGLPCPAIALTHQTAGRWLLKPIRGAAGFGIVPYTGGRVGRRTFLQERLDGDPVSGTFLGAGKEATFIGVTRQLIGTPWLNTYGFHYAGNIGPLAVEDPASAQWRRIGAALVERFRLRGLFGVDAILRDGVPWPVEINPRYIAAVEVFERALGESILGIHGDCFVNGEATVSRDTAGAKRGLIGKAVLYARRSFSFPRSGPWRAALEPGVRLDELEYADVPHPGDVIEERQPVLTIFARGRTADECEANLREKAQALDRRLWG